MIKNVLIAGLVLVSGVAHAGTCFRITSFDGASGSEDLVCYRQMYRLDHGQTIVRLKDGGKLKVDCNEFSVTPKSDLNSLIMYSVCLNTGN